MPKTINHPLLPKDYTPEEYLIMSRSICNLYEILEDPTDKFLLAFVYELNYTQSMAAESLGKTDFWVSMRMTKIKKSLADRYKIKL